MQKSHEVKAQRLAVCVLSLNLHLFCLCPVFKSALVLFYGVLILFLCAVSSVSQSQKFSVMFVVSCQCASHSGDCVAVTTDTNERSYIRGQ